jgi:exopolyphosphatase / guanosine-5'-triphosphate,3'-diphosphate pyrophosphatase
LSQGSDVTSLMQMLGGTRRPRELEPIGVIDIGSNSVRLVVYEGAVRSPTPLFNEKVLCGLGRTVATTGRLGAEPIERTIQALTRFKAVARVLKVKTLKAFATAAVRDAADGPAFIARAEKACGVKIEILSGKREAELAAEGIRMGFQDPDGFAGDLGGGSLELIDIGGQALNEAITLPLGGLRLIDQTGGKIDDAVKLADAQLEKINWLVKGKGRPFYAVGGTWRALAKLHMEQTHYPLRIMQGYTVATRDAIEFCELVRRTKKIASLPGIEEVARARREALPYGALVLERLLRQLQPSCVIFSVHGVREGLLFSLLPPHERNKDPLLSFCEEFARQRSRSLSHALELCDWTDQLFDKNGIDETPEERRLRHAACLVSDIGWRVHPDYRGEQSLDKIAHAGMSGVDHPGRIFLGLTIYFRHAGAQGTGTDGLPEQLLARIDRRMLKRARIVGGALRAAHMISIGMPGVIDETRLTYRGDKLILTLPKQHADLDGERLRRRFESLAAVLGRVGEIRIVN